MLIKEGEEKAPSNDHGFPPGFFLLRSVSSGRLLDVASDSVQDGTPIILWPEKDNSLVEGKSLISSRLFFTNIDERIGFRRPEAANQVSNIVHHAPSVSPPLTDSKGILRRHQWRPLRSRIRTRARRPRSALPLFSRCSALTILTHLGRCSRAPCPQTSPAPHAALPKRIFPPSPAVPLQRPHRPSHRRIPARPRVRWWHRLARPNLLPDRAPPAPPAHAPRRGDGRAELGVPRSVVLSWRPVLSGDGT